MIVDSYHANIGYEEMTVQYRREILGQSGGADFLSPVLRNYAENLKGQ